MNKHHVTPASFYTLKFYAAGRSETEEILEFLEALGGITFDHLLVALKHGIERGSVTQSNRSMLILQEWVNYFNNRFKDVSPEWMSVWTKLKKQYQKFQEEEARRAAETAAMIKASFEEMSKQSKNLNSDPPQKTES